MKTKSPQIVHFQNITKVYKTENTVVEILKEVTFTITQGEFVAITGPSGSGKSTIMHIMGGLDTPTNGEYLLQGKSVSQYTDDQLSEIRNKDIGFVFQAFNLLRRTTVIKNVERPMMYGGDISVSKRSERAMAMLRLVNLEDKAENLSNQLSGGQMQRVAIARALVMNPQIILADEPTGNLDSKASSEIMTLLATLNKEGHTVVIITHDPDIAAQTPRTITIKDGRIISDKKI